MLRLISTRLNMICIRRQKYSQRTQSAEAHIRRAPCLLLAATPRVEHPLRNLQCRGPVQLITYASKYNHATPSCLAANIYLLPVPRMPCIPDFSNVGFMGVLYPSCTTKTGLIWAWTSRRPQAAKRPRVRARAATLSAYQGSGAYTIATTTPPDLPLQSIHCEIVDAKQCLPLNCCAFCCALFNIRDLLQVLTRPETPPLTPNTSSLFVPLTVNSRCNLGQIEF